MANRRLNTMIGAWERTTRELAEAFLQFDKKEIWLDLEYTQDPEIVYPYKNKNEEKIELLIRPTWTGFGDTDSFLELYQKYLDYAGGPGKGREYYDFIAEMPGKERGYWFNGGNGPLTVKGQFIAFMNPLQVHYNQHPLGFNHRLPFSVTKENEQVIFAKIEDNDSIEHALNVPQIIKSTPQLYQLLKQAEKKR